MNIGTSTFQQRAVFDIAENLKMEQEAEGNLTDRDAEDVGLQLHQQPVGGHSSVHLKLSQRDATVLIHGVQYLHRHKRPTCDTSITGNCTNIKLFLGGGGH